MRRALIPALARLSVAAPLIAALAGPASAAERDYRLRPDESALRFSYAEDGTEKAGRFDRFDAVGGIDPDAPATARLTLTISVDSVRLEDAFRTQFVQGADWFDADAHPQAVYELDGLIRLRGDDYIAVGTLKIKGREKRVSAPLTLVFDGDAARATGDLSFNRRDFDVGGGPASLFVTVGETISVAFDLSAEAVD